MYKTLNEEEITDDVVLTFGVARFTSEHTLWREIKRYGFYSHQNINPMNNNKRALYLIFYFSKVLNSCALAFGVIDTESIFNRDRVDKGIFAPLL